MKRYRLGVLVCCAIVLWIASPVYSDDTTSPDPAPAIQPQTEQPASPPDQPPAPSAMEQPTAPQPQVDQQPEQTAAEASPTPAAEEPVTKTAPSTAPEQPVQAPAAAEGIQIQDAALCQDVVDRAPVGTGDVFPKEIARVYCYSRVVGVDGESAIIHNWYYKGALKASVKLPVRSSNWRTYSSKTMTPEWTGEWMVEILSESGTPLESIIFFVQ